MDRTVFVCTKLSRKLKKLFLKTNIEHRLAYNERTYSEKDSQKLVEIMVYDFDYLLCLCCGIDHPKQMFSSSVFFSFLVFWFLSNCLILI